MLNEILRILIFEANYSLDMCDIMRDVMAVSSIFIILSFIFSVGCIEEKHDYALGVINVTFPSDVNMTKANETIYKHNCTIVKFFLQVTAILPL